MGYKKRNSVVNTDSIQLNTHSDTDVADSTVRRSARKRVTMVVFAVIAVIVSCILMISSAFSWFAPGEEADLAVKVTDFSTVTKYCITGSTYEELGSNVNIPVGSLGNLKLRVEYNGYSSAHIRVQLFESFKDSNGNIISKPAIDYTLYDKWVKYGNYYYYKDPVGLSKTLPVNVDFVKKAALPTGSNMSSDSTLNLVAVVEAVQPDRFDEFFGVSFNEVFGITDTIDTTDTTN